jgi:hypothetical protein
MARTTAPRGPATPSTFIFLPMIGRLYQARVETALRMFPAVALVGGRQTGKTTLAKAIGQRSRRRREFVYLDLELPSDAAKLSDQMQRADDRAAYRPSRAAPSRLRPAAGGRLRSEGRLMRDEKEHRRL